MKVPTGESCWGLGLPTVSELFTVKQSFNKIFFGGEEPMCIHLPLYPLNKLPTVMRAQRQLWEGLRASVCLQTPMCASISCPLSLPHPHPHP